MSQMKKAAEAEFREMVRNGLTNDGERNIMKKSASELKNMSKIKPDPEPYINNPLNWENELHDNISRRVNEISPDLSEEERKLQIDPIVLEEAEKLQKKYRTVYTASDFGKGKYSALIPLYRDYPIKETERSPLGEMITGAIQNGFYSGLSVAASQGIGNSGTKSGTGKTEGGNSKWFKADGTPKWPENNGFAGQPTKTTLQAGTKIDRYGNATGNFAAPEGTPYSQRSLPPGSENSAYHTYEVIKPFDVQAGITAPWFDQSGGGIQYLLPMSIQELRKLGYIRLINK